MLVDCWRSFQVDDRCCVTGHELKNKNKSSHATDGEYRLNYNVKNSIFMLNTFLFLVVSPFLIVFFNYDRGSSYSGKKKVFNLKW